MAEHQSEKAQPLSSRTNTIATTTTKIAVRPIHQALAALGSPDHQSLTRLMPQDGSSDRLASSAGEASP